MDKKQRDLTVELAQGFAMSHPSKQIDWAYNVASGVRVQVAWLKELLTYAIPDHVRRLIEDELSTINIMTKDK